MNLSDTGTAPEIFVPSPEAARAMAATKHLHFSPAEFAARQSAACAAMDDAGLDALVMFRQESMYYLTGYDTFGYVFFQCMLLTRDGRLVLVTRAPDLRQAHFTSVVDDVRVWRDGAGVEPALLLSDLLAEFGLTGGKVGAEWEAYGLTARNGRVVDRALAQSGCHVSDASLLVSRLRLKKSPAELAYAARAGELADAAWEAACARAGAGVSEADVLSDMHAVIMRGGGDDPANEFIIGSGPGALMCRYFTGRRTLGARDQLTLEWAGAYRHYHAAMMRTLIVGTPSDRQRALHAAAHDALLACEEALQPGVAVGAVFDAHAKTLDAHGLADHRLNACGYCMGATYGPNWMDWPMLYAGQPVIAEPGMTFFLHMILFDSDQGAAATLGHTVQVTETGCARLSSASLDLVTV